MAYFELNQVFSYQDANEIKKLWASETPPATKGLQEVWLDTGITPPQLKRFMGKNPQGNDVWDIIGNITADTVLTLLKSVDGTASGVDADLLDGQHGTFFRNAANLNAGTISSARLSASDLLTLLKTVDGTGSGLDADTIDGKEAADFFQKGSNIALGDKFISNDGDSEGINIDNIGNAYASKNLRINNFLSLGAPTTLIISNGVVTVTKSHHTIDTEGGAASDYLESISGGTTGDILVLRSENTARQVTVRDQRGNIFLSEDFLMSTSNRFLVLINKDGTNWLELSRSINT